MRSRGRSLPAARCRLVYFSPPPTVASASAARSLSTAARLVVRVRAELGPARVDLAHQDWIWLLIAKRSRPRECSGPLIWSEAQWRTVIEEAKSGRASCRTCKKTIGKGELRLGVEVQNQFSDTPSMAWHHVLCAAGKLPAELKEALAAYPGEVAEPRRARPGDGGRGQEGRRQAGGLPVRRSRAPTGRAKCMQCSEAIEKGSFRVAVEREVDTGSFATRSAGYLHPRCVVENLENVGGVIEDELDGLRKNSRIAPEDLDAVVGEIGGA